MKKFILFAFLLPSFGYAQVTSGFHRVNQIIARGNSGVVANIVPNASIFVANTSNGVAATIYSDPGLTITIPGALLTTDANGNYNYYLPLNTCVTENISSPSQGTLVVPNVCGNAGITIPIGPQNGGTGSTTPPTSGQVLVGQSGSVYAPETLFGDCTVVASGAVTCLKTNGVPFTTAATTPLGTSGATIPLLSTSNIFGQDQSIVSSGSMETQLNLSNTTSKSWSLQVSGSGAASSGLFSIIDNTDSISPMTFSSVVITANLPMNLQGSPVCTTANGACVSGTGTVTSFSTGTWPSWLTPSVTSSTTTPVLSVVASPIPVSALVSSTTTINGTACTLGASCSLGTTRSCNANGCYIIMADGTIEEWGTAGPGGCVGVNDCSVSVVFPFPFTTTSQLSIQATSANSTSGRGNFITAVAASPSTTGFVIQYGAMSYIGLTGGDLTGSQTANWFAIGH